MNLSSVLIILGKLGLSTSGIAPVRPGQIICQCPLAPWLHEEGVDRNPSFGVKFGGEFTYFNCFTCGQSGKLWYLVDTVAELKDSDELRKLALEVLEHDQPNLMSLLEAATSHVDPQESFVPDVPFTKRLLESWPPVRAHPGAAAYLSGRGYPEEVWETLDLRWDDRRERIVFPVYDTDGNLRGANGRIIGTETPDNPKYHNYWKWPKSHWFGAMNLLRPGCPRMCVVEGWTCLARCREWAVANDCDVVCSFGARLEGPKQALLEGLDRTTYLLFDTDAAGAAGLEKAVQALAHRMLLKFYKLPSKRDVDTLTQSEFEQLLAALRFSL